MLSRLNKLRDNIESFDKTQQIQILRLLKSSNLNENNNGVFINLTDLNESTIIAVEEHVGHIKSQELLLKSSEDKKDTYKEAYFKDNKDTTIIVNNGNI